MNGDLEFDSLMKQMASEHQPELPAPGLIWWRAQIMKKQAERQRIERPVAIMRLVAAVAWLVLAALLWAGLPEVRHVFDRARFEALAPLLLAAIVIFAVLGALMWWTTSEAS